MVLSFNVGGRHGVQRAPVHGDAPRLRLVLHAATRLSVAGAGAVLHCRLGVRLHQRLHGRRQALRSAFRTPQSQTPLTHHAALAAEWLVHLTDLNHRCEKRSNKNKNVNIRKKRDKNKKVCKRNKKNVTSS